MRHPALYRVALAMGCLLQRQIEVSLQFKVDLFRGIFMNSCRQRGCTEFIVLYPFSQSCYIG